MYWADMSNYRLIFAIAGWADEFFRWHIHLISEPLIHIYHMCLKLFKVYCPLCDKRWISWEFLGFSSKRLVPSKDDEMTLLNAFCLRVTQKWMRDSWVQGRVVFEGDWTENILYLVLTMNLMRFSEFLSDYVEMEFGWGEGS